MTFTWIKENLGIGTYGASDLTYANIFLLSLASCLSLLSIDVDAPPYVVLTLLIGHRHCSASKFSAVKPYHATNELQ